MRILVVCSKNSGKIAPFIQETSRSHSTNGYGSGFFFTIEGKGWKGYLKNRPFLTKKNQEFKPNVIHAHYGLSGLLANAQRKVPVVTTYHGSDKSTIQKVFRFSIVAMRLSHGISLCQKKIYG
jgi:hypothetical protein